MDKILNAYFSHRGRLGRLNYFLYSLALGIFCAIFFGGMQFVLPPENAQQTASGMEIVFALLMLIVALVVLFASVILAIKRFHDLDKSGWWYLIAIIPIVNILVGIYLLFFKGTEGPNRFGAPVV